MSKRDFVKLLNKNRDLELDQVKAVEPTRKGMKNVLAATLLECIIHDSRKHAALFKAMTDVESGTVPREMDVGEGIDMTEAIDEHIEVESEMIKQIESMLENVEDDKVRVVLQYILEEEHRHHSTLQRMADLFGRGEEGYEEYYDLFEKFTYSGPEHGRKAHKY